MTATAPEPAPAPAAQAAETAGAGGGERPRTGGWWRAPARIWRRASALLFLAVLVWVARKLGWRAVLAQLATARPEWLGAAILLQLLVLALWAALWRSLLPPGQRVRYITLLSTVTLSGAAMLVVPSLAGQASAGALLVQRCRLSVVSAASLLLGEQVGEAAAKAAVLLLALALAPLPPTVRTAAWIAALIFGGAAALALVSTGVWQRARVALRRPGILLRASAVAVMIKAVEAGVLLAVQRSLGVHLGAGALLLLLALAALGIMAGSLLPVPGPIGVGEAVVAAGYVTLGLPLALGLALVALHSATLVLPRLTGAASVLLADATRRRVVAASAPSTPDVVL